MLNDKQVRVLKALGCHGAYHMSATEYADPELQALCVFHRLVDIYRGGAGGPMWAITENGAAWLKVWAEEGGA